MKAHSAQSGFPKGRFINRPGGQVCGARRGLCNGGGRRGGDCCSGFEGTGGLWHREGALQQEDDYISVMVEKTASGSWRRCRDTLGTTASSPLVQMEKG